MKYAVLMFGKEADWDAADEAAQAEEFAAHDAFMAEMARRGAVVAGEALQSVRDATTMRHEGGRWALTDGPYAETAEQLGGFYVVDAQDLDTVLAVCELLPRNYVVEVRPVMEVPE